MVSSSPRMVSASLSYHCLRGGGIGRWGEAVGDECQLNACKHETRTRQLLLQTGRKLEGRARLLNGVTWRLLRHGHRWLRLRLRRALRRCRSALWGHTPAQR